MTALIVLSSVGVAVSLGYYAAATVAALQFARRAAEPAPPLPKVAPKVAVLKPLHGVHERLAANLVSILEAPYPRAEYYFGVSGYDDPAAEVPAALRPRYQFANMTMMVGEHPGCANRKVAKLIDMQARADKADIFVLSDADVSVEHDYLRRVIGELVADDDVGIVTCAYRARPLSTLASRLEALYVNTDFAPQVFLAAAIEPMHYALGATIAIKRTALDAIGGFRAIKDVLADDYYLGKLVSERGDGIKLSSEIVTLSCEEQHFSDFWDHQLRWARTYRTVRPESVATIFTHGLFWALLLVAATRGSTAAMAVVAVVIAARLSMSAAIISRVLKLPELISDVWLVPIKDLAMTGIWFASLMSNQVTWAGRRFEVMRGGVMRELKDS
ncbi:MAG TPA: bacteriohopanetetrol glucosamine biosynthesis glycosyltransferase HpnI [Candidatus Binataceae bacterium]|nr:bacteriohopanetetrol glucosamine biosynthesis glycosyltransferase HpnI [Candidatus Binataceae bacterium]